MNQTAYIHLGIFIICGFIAGLLVKKLLIPGLAKLARKTSFKSDDLIIKVIGSWVIGWFVALGIYFGLKYVELPSKYDVWLERATLIFFISSATIILARILVGMIAIRGADGHAGVSSSSIIANILKVIVYSIGILVILQSVGISVTPILAGLGVGGLAVALALQPTLSNLFAGLQLIASGKLLAGNFVKLASGEEGFVEDITWRSTTIRAMANHLIIIPNSKMADMIVLNYNLPDMETSFNLEVGVAYDSDLDHVERVAIEEGKKLMETVEGGVRDYEPLVRFQNFGDSSITVRIILRVTEYSFQFAARSQFLRNIHKRFDEEGINIPFPIRTVYMPQQKQDQQTDDPALQ